MERDQDEVHHRHHPADASASRAAADRGEPGGSRRAGRARTTSAITAYDVQVSVDGGALDGLADRDDAPRPAVYPASTVTAMPSGSAPATRRATGARGTSPRPCAGRPRRSPSAASATVRPTASPYVPRPAPRRPSSAPSRHRPSSRSSAGRARAGGSTWYQVVGPLTEWTAVRSALPRLGRRPDRQPTLVARHGPRTRSRVAAAIGGVGLGTAPARRASASARRPSPARRSRRTATARRTRSASTGRTRSAGPARPAGLPGERDARRRRTGQPARGRPADDDLERDRRRPPAADGRYLVSLVGRPGAATLLQPGRSASGGERPLGYGVTIDTVAPIVRSATVSGSLLSPNGDGSRDSVRVSIAAAGATGWAFGVAPVRGLGGRRAGPDPVRIRRRRERHLGRPDERGALVADGTYRLQIVAFDAAGNRVEPVVDRPRRPVAGPPSRRSRRRDLLAERRRRRRHRPASPGRPPSRSPARSASSAAPRSSARGRSRSRRVRCGDVARDDAAGQRVAGRRRYTVRVSGRDAAGNATTRAVTIRVDRTLAPLRWSPARSSPRTAMRSPPPAG